MPSLGLSEPTGGPVRPAGGACVFAGGGSVVATQTRMAETALLPLALSSSLSWPAWTALGLSVLSGALWFSDRPAERAPAGPAGDDEGPGESARIRELRDIIDELTRSRAAALEAAQRRDEFVTTISHELRSPLNAILGWTQVLEPRRDLPPDVADALRVIRRNALRQRQLLDDLVDMSRVVSGALRIDPRPLAIDDAIEEACQAIGPELERKGVRLDCQRAPAALVSGDPQRLQQVLRNLLANALRFTPAGGLITVRATGTAAGVAIAVSDTGAGIDPAFLPHVFEPFRQQPGAASRDRATLGLGLSLARMIVVGHGGRLTAHSDGPGRGATFTVTLPALAADATPARPIEALTSAGETPLRGVRVLAVDDEPDWRELLGHILGAAGAEARIAASAAEAIQILETWRPDVVLTDIAMPGTDGYGLLASIRGRGGAGRAVPAVAMTAHANAEERSRTARAGFAEHLAKPIPPHELVDAVRRVAEQPRAKGAGSD
jgi:signal transduction histidine kinase/ActR/RegA family two-component response regulator